MSQAQAQMDERTRLELQRMLEMEQQKAQFQGMVHNLTGKCWDLCMGMSIITKSWGSDVDRSHESIACSAF